MDPREVHPLDWKSPCHSPATHRPSMNLHLSPGMAASPHTALAAAKAPDLKVSTGAPTASTESSVRLPPFPYPC